MSPRRAFVLLLTAAALWCALIAAAPVFSAPPGGFLYRFFSPVCHQDDARSLHIFGLQLAVCARCTAIYFGFLAGVILSSFLAVGRRYPPKVLWIVAAGPMLLDVASGMLGIHDSSLVTRLVTGGLFGTVSALILTPILLEAIGEIDRRRLMAILRNAAGPGRRHPDTKGIGYASEA